MNDLSANHEGLLVEQTNYQKTLHDRLYNGRLRLHGLWLRYTFDFAQLGKRVSIHPSCDIRNAVSRGISIGDDAYLAQDVWLNVASQKDLSTPRIIIGRGCQIGRRATISSLNQIVLEDDVLLAPSVLITDHNHRFSDVTLPIHAQGVTEGGKVTIGRNSWLGHGAVIVGGKGDLTIGRNSVVAANSVVTRGCAPFSVLAGSPARVIKKFDASSGEWVRHHE